MTHNNVPPPRNIVFDLGGVLIDWNPRHHYRRLFDGDEPAMETFLSTVCTQAWNEKQDAGRSIAAAEAELIARHPDKADLIRAYYGGFDRMMRGAIEDSVAILEELHRRGTPLYALTNWSAETFPRARRRFDFLARFRGIVVSGELGVMKPDPRIFAHLLATHGLDAADCVFIDDSPRNVAAALDVGFRALHFKSPQALRADLAALGLL
ncbi:MAG: HAD family phosphatase [Proteobacteria bacterium]|nr:HAD family phosphatase [Pseudomonadota bacterium]